MFASAKRDVFILLLVCAAAFWWRLGRLGLFDPDEPFYAQTAREMLAQHDWVTPRIFGAPQFEKPILYYWLVMGSYRLLGESELAGRVPAAVAATLLVALVYGFGARRWGRRAGFLSALVLATGIEFIVTARFMLTDMVFSLFVCGAAFSFWMAVAKDRRRDRWVALSFACSALAVLTKGPLGSLIPALAAATYLIVARRRSPLRGPGLWAGLAIYALIAAPWYASMLAKFGWGYVDAFFVHENITRFLRAEHASNNRIEYYLEVLAIGSLPWTPLLVASLWRVRRAARDGAGLYLWCWILSSLLFLTAAQSKLPTYALFLFVPLALLMGSTLDSLLAEGWRSRVERWLILGLGLAQAAAALCVLAVTSLRPFSIPAIAMAAVWGMAFVLGRVRPSRGWVLMTASSTVLLNFLATTTAATTVEAMTSVREAAARVLSERSGREPVVTSPPLARGVHYYTRVPVSVLSGNPRPFFTPHPLPVVLGVAGLVDLVHESGSAICVMRERDWNGLRSQAPATLRLSPHQVGGTVLVRVEAQPELQRETQPELRPELRPHTQPQLRPDARPDSLHGLR